MTPPIRLVPTDATPSDRQAPRGAEMDRLQSARGDRLLQQINQQMTPIAPSSETRALVQRLASDATRAQRVVCSASTTEFALSVLASLALRMEDTARELRATTAIGERS